MGEGCILFGMHFSQSKNAGLLNLCLSDRLEKVGIYCSFFEFQEPLDLVVITCMAV